MSETPHRQADVVGPIPAQAGIGLRSPHHRDFLHGHPRVAWLEVHSENFFAGHGVAGDMLAKIRRDYPISLHGVGLSLGSSDPLDATHVDNLCRLVERIEPALVSEHLSWGSVGGTHTNDLLPLPYTPEAIDHISNRIDVLQGRLKRRILIENVSSYLEFESSEIPEWEFLTAVAQRSGAQVLLDVNNVYVNALNHGFDPETYIDAIPAHAVGEIHLAGHSRQDFDGFEIVVDTHDTYVCDEVWRLFEHAIARIGLRPTLIEWDAGLPPLDELLAEAQRAQAYLDRVNERAA